MCFLRNKTVANAVKTKNSSDAIRICVDFQGLSPVKLFAVRAIEKMFFCFSIVRVSHNVININLEYEKLSLFLGSLVPL